jgi:hypothetical protein
MTDLQLKNPRLSLLVVRNLTDPEIIHLHD